MSLRPALFRNVADRDYLGFWADRTLKAREVADFLDLKKSDLAKVAGVSSQSVRFDEKMPREVRERLTEIANICALVAQFFEGDVKKTALWFQTQNTLLGDITPRDMIRYGRYAKLREFVIAALEENEPAQASPVTKTRPDATAAPAA
jgi:DNA-binding XRE family transcriptional regulator